MSLASSIAGVVVRPLREIADARGAVLHVLRSDAAEFTTFGECYLSEVVPGGVKAWKRHREQLQQLAVPVGRIRLVVFDDRPDSPTNGALDVLELGRPDAYARVTLPPRLWYGFACVGDTAALLVNCADRVHDPAESDHLPPAGSPIPYTW